MKKLLLLIFLCLIIEPVFAGDLPIVSIDQNRLPYEFSASNYDNSSSNYNNSVSNYDNSSSNYNNSESNYDNSSSNYNNGRNGSHRLILKDGGALKFAGYFVTARSGVTNFFSPSGKRMFYNPKNGHAVFNGESGDFCGVLARFGNDYSLGLTDEGFKILMLTQ